MLFKALCKKICFLGCKVSNSGFLVVNAHFDVETSKDALRKLIYVVEICKGRLKERCLMVLIVFTWPPTW